MFMGLLGKFGQLELVGMLTRIVRLDVMSASTEIGTHPSTYALLLI